MRANSPMCYKCAPEPEHLINTNNFSIVVFHLWPPQARRSSSPPGSHKIRSHFPNYFPIVNIISKANKYQNLPLCATGSRVWVYTLYILKQSVINENLCLHKMCDPKFINFKLYVAVLFNLGLVLVYYVADKFIISVLGSIFFLCVGKHKMSFVGINDCENGKKPIIIFVCQVFPLCWLSWRASMH